MIVVQNLAKKVMTLKVKMAAMPILLAIVSQGSDTGPLWSSCLTIFMKESIGKAKVLSKVWW